MQQSTGTYAKMEKAIRFIIQNKSAQPGLQQIAEAVGMSPFHLQRLFTEWSGLSPKQFLKALTLEHAKAQLRTGSAPLFDAALASGLSGSSRLHDLFVSMEAITPGEYKTGGEHLNIRYAFYESLFGPILCASTDRGVCLLEFIASEKDGLARLKKEFPKANLLHESDPYQRAAMSIFQMDWHQLPEIKLHLKASEFQYKVWQCLLQIPYGGVSSYATIASSIGQPSASRAVGTAIGRNPVAFIIPCHRVLQSSGGIGGYRWGIDRKYAILTREFGKTFPNNG